MKNPFNSNTTFLESRVLLALVLVCVFFPSLVSAATLRLSPDTGIYTVGDTFSVSIIVNTQNKPINAADAELSFNPKELSVVSVNRASSIFNLWTLEPTFSNTAGTVSLGGGLPSGYSGTSGSILSVTFRTQGAGTPKVNFKTGSILAADGLGTNVLTAMNGGTYTVSAKTTLPPAEYVPPPNTPDAPKVISTTHPDETLWYAIKDAKLTWAVPPGITSVRTLLDRSPNTIPTIVYNEPIKSREITDLSEGTSYFHIQLRNADGWGRVTHFKLNVDTEAPREFSIREESTDSTNPNRTLQFDISDTSPITKYLIQIDGGEPTEFIDAEGKKQYVLERNEAGRHTVVIEAFDSVGKSAVASYAFDVSTFEAPVFTEYPERLNAGVIPALKGTTRPDVSVQIVVRDGEREFGTYQLESDSSGAFIFIPDKPLLQGVYAVTAQATDVSGAQSEVSESIRIIVEEPGYVTVGSFVIRLLSVIVPLIALTILLVFGSWFLWFRLHSWKRKVMKETVEAEDRLKFEFDAIVSKLHTSVTELKTSRLNKLTRAELQIIENIETDLRSAQSRIRKEITDIEDVVE